MYTYSSVSSWILGMDDRRARSLFGGEEEEGEDGEKEEKEEVEGNNRKL